MTIKEVEELLSVSRANIRFYEKEGLLSTNRKSNNYCDYSEENIQDFISAQVCNQTVGML